MAVIRSDKADRTVQVHSVVPQDKIINPGLCLLNAFKGFRRVARAVFHGPEKRLGIGVVIADTGPGERCGDAQFVQSRHHGGDFHRTAIVRMQNQSFGQHIVDETGFGKQPGTVLHGLFGKDLGGHDLPAPDINYHVEVIKYAPDRGV